jgi:hypothetical protein
MSKRNILIAATVATGAVVGVIAFVFKSRGGPLTPMDKCKSERMRDWNNSGRVGPPPDTHCKAELSAIGEDRFNAKYGY